MERWNGGVVESGMVERYNSGWQRGATPPVICCYATTTWNDCCAVQGQAARRICAPIILYLRRHIIIDMVARFFDVAAKYLLAPAREEAYTMLGRRLHRWQEALTLMAKGV